MCAGRLQDHCGIRHLKVEAKRNRTPLMLILHVSVNVGTVLALPIDRTLFESRTRWFQHNA